MNRKHLTIVLLTFLFVGAISAADIGPRGKGIHDGNKITAEFWNYGSLSNPGNTNNTNFLWNGLGYGYEFGLLVTAEVKVPPRSHPDSRIKLDELGNPVVDTNGDTVWVARIISDGLVSLGGETSPDGLEFWGWQPVAGYSNNGYLSQSDKPNTWSEDWQYWPGRHGENIVLADQESYFRFTDQNNNEFKYYPQPADSSIQGLGLEISCRIYQINEPLLEDCLILTYNITNIGVDSLFDIQAGYWGDPHIGGPSDWPDDLSFFNLEENLAYAWDADGTGEGGLATGIFGIKYLDTPDNVGLQCFSAPNWTSANRLCYDNYFYTNFLQPGIFDSTNFKVADDRMFTIATGMFSIASGETRTVAAAVVLGADYDDLILNGTNAQKYYNNHIKAYPAIQHEISLEVPQYNDVIAGTYSIQWHSSSISDNPLLADLFINNNSGTGWELIASGINDEGSYLWNTSSFPDGYNYQILLYAYDDSISGVSVSDYFIVNNADVETDIEVLLTDPVSNWTNPIYSGVIPIQWRAGDADGNTVEISILVSGSSGWEYITQNEVNDGLYNLNTRSLANGSSYRLKLEATDGEQIIESNVVEVFTINNEYYTMPDDAVTHTKGAATGTVEAIVIDPDVITGHTYELSFNDSGSVSYNIIDLMDSSLVLENIAMISEVFDGPYFHGMRLRLANHDCDLNEELTDWSLTSQSTWEGIVKPFNNIETYAFPGDYEIRFYDELVDSSSRPNYGYIKTNFEVWDVTSGRIPTKKPMFILETAKNDSLFTPGDRVIILETLDPVQYTWEFTFNISTNSDTVAPGDGDVFHIFTDRPFSADDVYLIDTKVLGIERPEPAIPDEYSLSQNYPNPFNPVTTIEYSIANPDRVKLEIFDILGRQVAELVDSDQNVGTYKVFWNAGGFASGVYFYRISAGEFAEVRKLVVLK